MKTVTTPRMEQHTKTSADSQLRLVLPNRAENVAVVRRALGGVVDVLELTEAQLLDINAAVSEACNNVVVHAYDGGEGPMDVHLSIQSDELVVIVSDHGVGIRPNVPDGREVQGLGLSLIHALTDWVEFQGGTGEGTQVRMGFSFDSAPERPLGADHDGQAEAPPLPGEVSITVTSGPLAAPVLGRVIGMLAARAEFSLEGISEAELVTDAVAAHAPRAMVGDRIQLGIDRPNGQLIVRVGPFKEGGATRVVKASALEDLPPVLERLTEDHRVESSGNRELLCLVLGPR